MVDRGPEGICAEVLTFGFCISFTYGCLAGCSDAQQIY
jgi:hypothetical protein